MRGAHPAPRGVRVLSRRHMHRFPRTGAPGASLLTKTNIPQQLYFKMAQFRLLKPKDWVHNYWLVPTIYRIRGDGFKKLTAHSNIGRGMA